MPVIAHTTSSHPADPTNRPISAETMKTPDPIIDPATSMVESSKPSCLTNPSDVVSSSFTPPRDFESSAIQFAKCLSRIKMSRKSTASQDCSAPRRLEQRRLHDQLCE